MIIENVEALRSWLTDKLRPICDADPSALAKYVVALIKKEKPMKELKDVCADQLDVFLADETKRFVDELFQVLESKSYLPTNQLMIKPTVDVAPSLQIKEPSDTAPSENVVFEKEEVKGPGEEVVETNIKETPGLAEMIDEKQQAPESVPSDKKDDNVSEAGTKKRRASNRHYDSTDRGRSRYYRQPRQGKDFDTIVDEFLNAKKPRNVAEGSASRGRSVSPGSRRSPRRQSPGGKRYRGRRERRRRSEERRNVRKRQRCRDYDEKGVCLLGNSCPFDHGRDPVIIDDAAIPNILGMQGIGAQPLPIVQQSPPVPPGQEMFGGIFASSMIVNPVASIPTNSLSQDAGLTLVSGLQRSLPSVAELPHTVPLFAQPQPALTTIQTVVEERSKESRKDSKVLAASEASKSQSGSEAYNPEEPSIDLIEQPAKPNVSWVAPTTHSVSSSQTRVFNTFGQFPPTTITAEQFLQKMYTPSSAILSSHLPQVSIPNAINSILQRNLMALPTVQPLPGIKVSSTVESQAPMLTTPAVAPSKPPNTSQPHIASPARRPFMNQTILEIRKIPFDSNTVVKLSEYFQKFGKIVNIQVNYENDPQAALIQFASNSEARRAYSSPEAVLGNRFIKIFWHNKTKELPPMKSQVQVIAEQNTLKTGTENVHGTENTSVEVTKPKLPSTGETTYVNPQSTQKAALKKQAEMKKEGMKKKLEIQKQRRLLLEKQIKEQKVLITKLEKNKNMGASEKQLLMTALKTLTSSIEKLKTDLEAQAKASKPMSKQALEKEMLDREIELYNKQYSNQNPADPKNAVSEPQEEALTQQATKPVARGRGRGRGRGISRGRGLPGTRGSQHTSRAVVDNRPKEVLVTGYEEKDKDAVVAQFASHGEIDRVEEKPGSKLVLSFRTRRQAEIAATKSAVFNGKPLVLAWYTAAQQGKRSAPSNTGENQPAKIQRRETRRSSLSSLLGDDKEEALLDDFDVKEADLLLLEEDEEEDEERSWKR